MSNAKTDILFKCERCFDTNYVVDLNENGTTNIYLCDDCVSRENYPGDIVIQAKAKCKIINDKFLNPDNETKFNLYLKSLSSKKEFENIVRALSLFLEQYPEAKRKMKHIEMYKNPNDFRIVRRIEPHQFTAIHLFTRNQIFQIISKENRAKKTRIDEFGQTIDISEDRSFLGWSTSVHFTISGPALCTQDQAVFDACVKLWHEKTIKGIMLTTNLSEIWQNLGNKSNLSQTNKDSLKRSLSRLSTTTILVKSMDKNIDEFWNNKGILQEVKYAEKKTSKENKIIITFNLNMVNSYLKGSYATLNHHVYTSLSSYSKKIYLFLMSHKDTTRQISLEKLKLLIGVDEKVSKPHFKKYINKSLKELMDCHVLDTSSKIENEIMYTTVLKDAWKARPTSPKLISL